MGLLKAVASGLAVTRFLGLICSCINTILDFVRPGA